MAKRGPTMSRKKRERLAGEAKPKRQVVEPAAEGLPIRLQIYPIIQTEDSKTVCCRPNCKLRNGTPRRARWKIVIEAEPKFYCDRHGDMALRKLDGYLTTGRMIWLNRQEYYPDEPPFVDEEHLIDPEEAERLMGQLKMKGNGKGVVMALTTADPPDQGKDTSEKPKLWLP